MLDAWTLGIAVLALLGSAYTAWLTLLRRGTVRMTQPTVVFFGPDGGRPDRAPKPKVFLRTLLYSTADRGQVLENMYVILRRGAESTTFAIWVYGDQSLVRGSGLFVGREGFAANHHFLLRDNTSFVFQPGNYDLEVFATTAGEKHAKSLWKLALTVPAESGTQLGSGGAGLYFDWNPESRIFERHLESPALANATRHLRAE